MKNDPGDVMVWTSSPSTISYSQSARRSDHQANFIAVRMHMGVHIRIRGVFQVIDEMHGASG